MIKNYFRKYSYSLKLGLVSYFILGFIVLFSPTFEFSTIKNGFIFSPLVWIISVPTFGPLLHVLASIVVLVFTLYRERKLSIERKTKIIFRNLLALFVLDVCLLMLLIVYTVLNQIICGLFHSHVDVCALFFGI